MAELEIVDEAQVRWIALNRPESKNGLTEDLNQQIITSLTDAETNPAVRAVVLTGKGGNFCSGLDLKAAAARGSFDNLEEPMRKYFHGMIRAVRNLSKPTIALLDGAAVGFGADLAFVCDIRLGTERTRIGEIFVKRGLMPDGGGTFSLPRLVGVAKALELMFTGDILDAEESLRLGLITKILPSAEAETATWAYAKKIAAGPPLVYAEVKRAVYGSLESSFDEALEREVTGQMKMLKSKDFFEGVSAFFQKRPPVFHGE